MDILVAIAILIVLVYFFKSLLVAVLWIIAAAIAVSVYRYIKRGRSL